MHGETETKLVPVWKTLGFPHKIRLPSTTIQLEYLNPDHYRAFNLIQGSIITLARFDEPYMQNYGKFMETPIPRART